MSGRRVAQRLTGHGMVVRIGSRSAEPPFDWGNEATWAPALQGATSAYLTYHPDIGFPSAAEKVGAFVGLALHRGVRRLVLLSGRGSQGALRAEQALRESGADWTIVRSSWFAQNFDEGFMTDQIRSGVLAFPAAAVAEPFIDADDVADVAAAALTDDRHIGQVYELGGPRLLTFADVAEEISRAAGRTVRYAPISFEDFAHSLTDAGVPADFVAETVAVFQTILDGRNANTTDGVQRALGRPPRDFTAYARTAAATGVWAVA